MKIKNLKPIILISSVAFLGACSSTTHECKCPKVEKEIVTVVEKCPKKEEVLIAPKPKQIKSAPKVAIKKPVVKQDTRDQRSFVDPRESAEKRRAELEKERNTKAANYNTQRK